MSSPPEKTDRNNEIVSMFNMGCSLKEIGKAYGITYQRVKQIIDNRKRKERREQRDLILADMLSRDCSPEEISKATGLDMRVATEYKDTCQHTK